MQILSIARKGFARRVQYPGSLTQLFFSLLQPRRSGLELALARCSVRVCSAQNIISGSALPFGCGLLLVPDVFIKAGL